MGKPSPSSIWIQQNMLANFLSKLLTFYLNIPRILMPVNRLWHNDTIKYFVILCVFTWFFLWRRCLSYDKVVFYSICNAAASCARVWLWIRERFNLRGVHKIRHFACGCDFYMLHIFIRRQKLLENVLFASWYPYEVFHLQTLRVK